MEPKFKVGDSVKLKDDVVYGEKYGDLPLHQHFLKNTKYIIADCDTYENDVMPDYIFEGFEREYENYVGEDALELWSEPVSHPVDEARKEANDRIQQAKNFEYKPQDEPEQAKSEIDPQLFELVKVILPSYLSLYDPTNALVPNKDNYEYMAALSVSTAKETLRLLREEKNLKQ